MEHLVFLYDIICYTVSFAGYIFAIFTALLWKRKEEWIYVLFMTAFLLFFVPSMIYHYFFIAKVEDTGIINRVFSLTSIAGYGLIIYTVPSFMHAVTKFKKARIVDMIFLGVAIIFCVITLVFLDSSAATVARTLLFIAMLVAIAYAVVAENIFGRMALKREGKKVTDLRWSKMMSAITILTLTLMPFSVVIDMFPETFPAITSLLSPYFRIYPLYFMLWNLLYVITTVPLYVRKYSAKPGVDACDFSQYHISRRQEEIALLVIEGLSYKEIADRLHISLATVKTHIMRIFKKTGADNKMELANRCRKG